MAMQISAGRAKTDARYWQSKVFRPSYVRGGRKFENRSYAARIAWNHRRHTFSLGTSNAENAAKQAARIFSSLLVDGWESTLAKFAPSYAPKPARIGTIGEFIEAAQSVADVKPRTLADYARALRLIVAEAFEVDPMIRVMVRRRIDGKVREIEKLKDARCDYRGGARDAWLGRVNKVPLSRLTPTEVRRWKLAYIRRGGAGGLESEKSARNTANSLIRQARALFSAEILESLGDSIRLPETLPFAGVKLERADCEYKSRIDPEALTRRAVAELFKTEPEALKVFLLALGAGLRAREIDFLEWRSFDFQAETLSVEPTAFYSLKTKKSARKLKLDPELCELFRGWRARATGRFVIESEREPTPGKPYQDQRAREAFQILYRWLRQQGVAARKAVHELRKEHGSLICEKAGIYAAMRALGHSRIDTTASHYVDQKAPVAVGIGAFLSPNVILFEGGKELANG